MKEKENKKSFKSEFGMMLALLKNRFYRFRRWKCPDSGH